jgi:hypothetical protein
VHLDEICDTDAFLIESSPSVVQALYFRSLKLTSSAYQAEMSCISRLDIFHFRLFSQRQVLANT